MNLLKSPQFGLRVASVIFGLACLAHLGRLVLQFPVVLCDCPLPLWANAGGFVIAGLLSAWLWMLSVPATPPPPPSATQPRA